MDRAEAAIRGLLAAADLPVRDLRVRDRGDGASVEVDADLVDQVAALPGLAEAVLATGYLRVEVDPRGFRSGSLNDELAARAVR